MVTTSQEIDAIREELGDKLLILGHHYQRSSVVQHADELGDSLELARKAGSNSTAERIVFCGVHFMAESADLLSTPDQTVYIPDTTAGCPMAGMASSDAMFNALAQLGGTNAGWIPVVYVNSTAELKACCGMNGGSTCTSSNAASVFKWVFDQGKRVLFLPDEHLGRNTAHDLGVPDKEVSIYDPLLAHGGLTSEEIGGSKVIVWKGFCIVHVAFTVDMVKMVREKLPEAKIIVHPETPKEVVDIVDAHGSTSQIIKYVEDAPDGSTVVIGTEINLVERLADQFRGRVTIKALSPSVCANMSKINESNLLVLLKNWPDENRIGVPKTIADDARASLNTMLAL
ncbi:MAG: quinolinate synthase NadA [Kiritimatiellae bacterium]|nr:quinolinate synthase NadA [Kiritimatiellia bacterium]